MFDITLIYVMLQLQQLTTYVLYIITNLISYHIELCIFKRLMFHYNMIKKIMSSLNYYCPDQHTTTHTMWRLAYYTTGTLMLT